MRNVHDSQGQRVDDQGLQNGTKTEVVTGAVSETYKSTKTENVTGAVQETFSSTQTTNVSSNVTITGSRIDLN